MSRGTRQRPHLPALSRAQRLPPRLGTPGRDPTCSRSDESGLFCVLPVPKARRHLESPLAGVIRRAGHLGRVQLAPTARRGTFPGASIQSPSPRQSTGPPLHGPRRAHPSGCPERRSRSAPRPVGGLGPHQSSRLTTPRCAAKARGAGSAPTLGQPPSGPAPVRPGILRCGVRSTSPRLHQVHSDLFT